MEKCRNSKVCTSQEKTISIAYSYWFLSLINSIIKPYPSGFQFIYSLSSNFIRLFDINPKAN